MEEEVVNEEHPANVPAGTPPAETPPAETPPAETPPGETPPAEEPPKEEPAPGELDCANFKFEGMEVTVEVPADLREELAGKGIDANKVVTELYTSEDFSLTAETKESLYKAFGKATVDSYLGALKDQNRMNMKEHTDQQAQVTAAEAVAWTETVDQIGGEESWAAMEQWAQATLSDADFDQFNSVMSSGNRYAQKLAVADMHAKYKAVEGDGAPNLINGDNVPPASTEGKALSAEEYRDLFKTKEYYKAPAKYDALRRKGQALGI